MQGPCSNSGRGRPTFEHLGPALPADPARPPGGRIRVPGGMRRLESQRRRWGETNPFFRAARAGRNAPQRPKIRVLPAGRGAGMATDSAKRTHLALRLPKRQESAWRTGGRFGHDGPKKAPVRLTSGRF